MSIRKRNPGDLRVRLCQLESPVKWKPEEGGSLRGLQDLRDHLIQGAKDCPSMVVPIYSLMAYIYTLSGEGQYRNPEEAENWAIKAIEEANKPIANRNLRRTHGGMDRSFVPRVLLAYVHFLKQETGRCLSLLKTLEADWTKRSQQMEAFVIGVHAHVASRFGPTDESGYRGKYELSLKLYREARKLDPSYPYYHFGVGFMMGRLSRLDHCFTPSEEELNAWRLANEMTGESDPVILIREALVLQDYTYKQHSIYFKKKHVNYACIARSLGETSVEVLNLCSVYFRKQKMFADHKNCLDRLITLPFQNYSSLCKAGRFYWKNTKFRDLKKAKQYLEQSVKKAPGGIYFWGEMNLLDFRLETEEQYNPISDLTAMLDKYPSSQSQAKIYLEMGQFFVQTHNRDNAFENLKKSLSLDPECKETTRHNNEYGVKSTTLLVKLAEKEFRGIDALFIKAWTLRNMIPPNYDQAKYYYNLIIKLEDNNHEATVGLVEIHHMLGEYEKAVDFAAKLCNTEYYSTNKQLLCKSKLALAEVLRNNEPDPQRSIEMYIECTKLGCRDAIQPLMELLPTCNMPRRQKYEYYADCLQCLAIPDHFSTMEIKSELTKDTLEIKIKEHLQITSKDKEMYVSRKQRWDMTVLRHSAGVDLDCSTQNVLQSARQSLDHIVCEFHLKHVFRCKCGAAANHDGNQKCKCNQNAYFPYKFKDKAELNRRLSEKGLENLEKRSKGKFAELYNFIWEHSCANNPAEYNWLPEFAELVNQHKHRRSLQMDDYENLYELAHKAADFAEMVVSEFRKYL